MAVHNLPWNCPNPHCQEPHNPPSVPIDGKIRCRSCGWEREVSGAIPVGDMPDLFELPDGEDPQK